MGYNNNGSVQQVEHQPQIRAKYELQAKTKHNLECEEMIMIPAVIMAIESDDDRAYMTDIYLKHHALMLKTAWTFTRVKAEVEDIVSDSCVSMIDNLQKLRTMEDHETRSYIVNIVRNTAINHWRKNRGKMRGSSILITR